MKNLETFNPDPNAGNYTSITEMNDLSVFGNLVHDNGETEAAVLDVYEDARFVQKGVKEYGVREKNESGEPTEEKGLRKLQISTATLQGWENAPPSIISVYSSKFEGIRVLDFTIEDEHDKDTAPIYMGSLAFSKLAKGETVPSIRYDVSGENPIDQEDPENWAELTKDDFQRGGVNESAKLKENRGNKDKQKLEILLFTLQTVSNRIEQEDTKKQPPVEVNYGHVVLNGIKSRIAEHRARKDEARKNRSRKNREQGVV